MIIKAITKFFIWFLTGVSSALINVLTFPISSLLVQLRPNLLDYESNLYYFVNTYLLRGVAFAREVFFNCTGYPRSLFNLLILYFLAKFTLHVTLLPARFCIKMYYILRGHHVKV